MKHLSLLLLLFVAFTSCKDQHADLPDGLYAEIETNKGSILLQLEYQKAPVTVANFVTLAEGDNKFVREELKGRPFFDGLTWHRVEPGFVIQGGDPDGTGAGDTGYKFKDEITNLRHDKAGTLSMANSGPGTNSSQFFITQAETPWLDGLHTVFGYVIGDGMQTVNKIAVGDAINSVTIIRKGESAKKFDAVKVFDNYFAGAAEDLIKEDAKNAESQRVFDQKYQAVADAKKAELETLKSSAAKSATGLQFKMIAKGSGKKPAAGTTVYIHYSGYLESGELFDSSVEAVAKTYGTYDPTRADAGGYRPIRFEYGQKTGLIPGFIEGIEKMGYGDKAVLFIPSYLGYGQQGAGGVIPPNANIIFEVELLENPN